MHFTVLSSGAQLLNVQIDISVLKKQHFQYCWNLMTQHYNNRPVNETEILIGLFQNVLFLSSIFTFLLFFSNTRPVRQGVRVRVRRVVCVAPPT